MFIYKLQIALYKMQQKYLKCKRMAKWLWCHHISSSGPQHAAFKWRRRNRTEILKANCWPCRNSTAMTRRIARALQFHIFFWSACQESFADSSGPGCFGFLAASFIGFLPFSFPAAHRKVSCFGSCPACLRR